MQRVATFAILALAAHGLSLRGATAAKYEGSENEMEYNTYSRFMACAEIAKVHGWESDQYKNCEHDLDTFWEYGEPDW